MPAFSASSSGCCRADWRSVSAMRGATLLMSSPRINTASERSISCNDAARAGPRSIILSITEISSHSPSATPAKKFSPPTRLRNAKLASSEARGEPIPIARPFAANLPQ